MDERKNEMQRKTDACMHEGKGVVSRFGESYLVLSVRSFVIEYFGLLYNRSYDQRKVPFSTLNIMTKSSR